MKHPRIRVVSDENTNRFNATRFYLNDQDITHLVKGARIYTDGEAGRWHVDLTFVAEIDFEVNASLTFKVADPVDELLNWIAMRTGKKPPRITIESWLLKQGICTEEQLTAYRAIQKKVEDIIK